MPDAHVDAPLPGQVALVTGASRGVGKGVALALGEAGVTVAITGRSLTSASGDLPGTLMATVAEIEARGGRAIPMVCNHADDDAVKAVVGRVQRECGRLDILVNNVFALPSEPVFGVPFWEQSLQLWDIQHRVGLRSHYAMSVFAVPLMLQAPPGGARLIANISSFGGGRYALNVAYGVGKAGVDRLAADMAVDLKPHGVTSVSLWPGVVRTERIVAQADALPFDMRVTESPELTGRAVVALAKDPERSARTGKRLVVAELAEDYGFDDIDGTRPRSLRKPRE